jgi:hypothetical protein
MRCSRRCCVLRQQLRLLRVVNGRRRRRCAGVMMVLLRRRRHLRVVVQVAAAAVVVVMAAVVVVQAVLTVVGRRRRLLKQVLSRAVGHQPALPRKKRRVVRHRCSRGRTRTRAAVVIPMVEPRSSGRARRAPRLSSLRDVAHRHSAEGC